MLALHTAKWPTGAGCKIVCDGNSLTFGTASSNPATKSYPAVLGSTAPFSGGTVVNLGIAGQTGAQMSGSRADVAAAYDASKRCTLVAWEFTNSIYLGATARQACDDLLTYASMVRADQPAWCIVLCTTLPRHAIRQADGAAWTQPNIDAHNIVIDAANALLRAEWASVADWFIDLRGNGSPFNVGDHLAATYDATGLFVQEAGVGGGTTRTHCSDAGYAEVARLVANGLRRMPER